MSREVLENFNIDSGSDKELPSREREEKIKQLQLLIENYKNEIRQELPEKNQKYLDNIFTRISELIQKGDFYQGKIRENDSFDSVSVHKWFFSQLPEKRGEEKEEYPSRYRGLIEILKSIEELSKPTLDQFLKGQEIVTETHGQFPLNDKVQVNMSVHRINNNEIYKTEQRSYMTGGDVYKLDISLVDSNGQIFHNFSNDLAPGSYISAGTKWQGGKDIVTLDTSESDLMTNFGQKGILTLAHEIGHNQQMNDDSFRELFKKQSGLYPEQTGMTSQPEMERNAWARGLLLLRKIEQETNNKILPSTEVINRYKDSLLESHHAKTAKG